MKSILKSINSILINWISTAIYCKTVQFSTVNQIQLATVHLNYINLLATVSSSDMSGMAQWMWTIKWCPGIFLTYRFPPSAGAVSDMKDKQIFPIITSDVTQPVYQSHADTLA